MENVPAYFGQAEYGRSLYGDISVPPIDFAQILLGLGVAGKLGKPSVPDPLGVYGIWQMRKTNRGKVPVKMKFYRPTNPRTVPQEANRSKFATAMAEWSALPPGDKAVYNERAKRRGMFGHGLFIREYYQANP